MGFVFLYGAAVLFAQEGPSEYARLFTFDAYENPKLQELRRTHKLDEVVARGKDEFDRQVLLLDWVHRRVKKFGRPTSNARGALEILKAVDEGHTFFCAHYGDVLVSAAASLGWVDRAIALRRPDRLGSGATEHTITEIWSNQHRKWVMFDPTFALWVEKDGVPLNAYEIRQEWFYGEGKGLVFAIGAERKRYAKKDLPVFIARHPGFGDLALDADTLHKYAFLGYVPNTNFLDAGPDWGKMFVTQDKICDGTSWHKRKNPADPARDPYFPLGQVAVQVARGEATLSTFTPNFARFEVRRDGEWKETPATFRVGKGRFEVRSVNKFGVAGAPTIVDVE